MFTYPSLIVLGSTGSVGTQALDVARANNIQVEALSANRDVDSIERQAREFKPRAVAMSDTEAAKTLSIRLKDTEVKVYCGADGICRMIEDSHAEAAVNAITGKAGLLPTLSIVRSGKRLALANKESLVVAGEIVMSEVKNYNTVLTPVDSEHCAIHQCLRAGNANEIQRLILTASGGPFFGKTKSELAEITVANALAHPTWKMGAKITIDSATLMNKGFEVIEAAHLFGVTADMIDVVVHRESIIHSMVEYIDNSVIAQLSVPDMRHCVQYALSYPQRTASSTSRLCLTELSRLTFAEPDKDTFVLLQKAYDALDKGGAVAAVLNAANEVAVDLFLHEKLSFLGISETVCQVIDTLKDAKHEHSLEGIIAYDKLAREKALELSKNIN
ncbi:MAG: 1-deoxy-D-xylulose-5-phosphate reductoisomerase [Clostridia bacterium]|nr:1-deoxy-D-xylulose-5-phosphate reductoisomerase [Clostridia bacterium]